MEINDKLKFIFQVDENKVIKDSDLKDSISIIYFYQKTTSWLYKRGYRI